MERELCIKCSNCQGLMKYDYYANKFKCKGCKNIIHLKEIDKNDIVIVNNKENNLVFDKSLSINFSEKSFLDEVKNALKYKVLVPDSFLKLKKLDESDINLIYIPLIKYSCKCIISFNDEEEISLYEINNMIFDEYANFDLDTLKSLYPVDLDSKLEEVKEDCFIDKNNIDDIILLSIQDKVKKYLDSDINSNKDFDILFLNEKIECILLPIYDYKINYNNKDYHFTMNANTNKFVSFYPIDNKKIILILTFFLIIDIIFFYLSSLARMIEVFCLLISILIFVIQILIILCIFFLTVNNENEINIKKFNIKKSNLDLKK